MSTFPKMIVWFTYLHSKYIVLWRVFFERHSRSRRDIRMQAYQCASAEVWSTKAAHRTQTSLLIWPTPIIRYKINLQNDVGLLQDGSLMELPALEIYYLFRSLNRARLSTETRHCRTLIRSASEILRGSLELSLSVLRWERKCWRRLDHWYPTR